MQPKCYSVIIAGGKGTRFGRSAAQRPKQLLKICPTKPYQRNNQPGVIHQRVKTNPRGYGGGTTERALQRATQSSPKEFSGGTSRQ
jgi:hypothetical protein